jgi:hypothetical protein
MLIWFISIIACYQSTIIAYNIKRSYYPELTLSKAITAARCQSVSNIVKFREYIWDGDCCCWSSTLCRWHWHIWKKRLAPKKNDANSKLMEAIGLSRKKRHSMHFHQLIIVKTLTNWPTNWWQWQFQWWWMAHKIPSFSRPLHFSATVVRMEKSIMPNWTASAGKKEKPTGGGANWPKRAACE